MDRQKQTFVKLLQCRRKEIQNSKPRTLVSVLVSPLETSQHPAEVDPERVFTNAQISLIWGFELWASHLLVLGRCSCQAPSPFGSGCFLDKVSLFLLRTWISILPFYASHHNWDDRPSFLLLRWGLANFFWPGWPQIMILLISASQVA
jgi:hypothetical protein